MAGKRSRAALAESDQDEGSQQSVKRVRTAEDPDNGDHLLTQTDGDVSDLEDEEPEAEPESLNEEEEARYEEENEDKMREKIKKADAKAQGGIAEIGIIEKLELHQFMCHPFLTFSLGPQINFIIGHNGSGKSAVLSALTVALGGKATVTGRGAGLKSFIREGQNVSEVSVMIKNQGEDAYRHNVYGDSIIITRRFTREGGSNYKIKAKNGKTVSTKREELAAICDHMNIQVDNPMNILTQDAARQFLSASTPADKYKFFLRGTQLSQLSEEYSTCLENISQTQRILKSKSEALPDLKRAYEETLTRYSEAKKARETQDKVDELKRELAWSHVGVKEHELREQTQKVEKLKRRIPKVEEEIAKAADALRAANDECAAAEEDISRVGDMDHLIEMQKDIKARQKQHKQELSQLKDDEKTVNREVQLENAQIERLQEQVANEQRRQDENNSAKREEARRALEDVGAQYAAVVEDIKKMESDAQEVRDKMRKAEADKQQIQAAGERAKSDIETAENQLRLIEEREKSKLAPFGYKMEQVLADIDRARWQGERPVGPLGRYVKLRDPKWANLMRSQIGRTMCAFAITNARDRDQLNQILNRHGNRDVNVIIAPRDIFDYSSGEPPEGFLTVLRVLEISDEYVLRILINSSSIERILVAPTRAAGDDLLRRLGGGGSAWTADMYNVMTFSDGGGRSSVLHQLHPNDRKNQLFTTEDLSAQTQTWKERHREAEQIAVSKGQEWRAWQEQYRQLQTELKNLDNRVVVANRKMRDLKRERDRLQEEVNEDMPVEIQALQLAIQELEESKKMKLVQFQEIAEKIAKANQIGRHLLDEAKAVKDQMDEFSSLHEAKQAAVSEAVEKRLQAQASEKYFADRLTEEKAKVEEAETQLTVVEEEFANWTSKAEKFCARIENPRPVAEVERHQQSVTRALEAQRRRNPVPLEELIKQLNARRIAYELVHNDIRSMVALNKSLRKSIKTRLQRWHEFRRHIALRCKMYFSYNLSQRGYFGKIIFDHVKGSLELKVQTDDMVGTQAASREKDPKSLSGGEKSFSTICLLLSLWESIGCPIRCLDEFDVFMDAVNRRISMKMMIETANASDRKQFILITPQDMNNVHITSSVRVHRMTDPERGQGTLAFANGA